jgi:SOS-response transcriptional repressor LexA
MQRTPDEKREILRRFINSRGLKIARWAKESAVDKNSIYNFLNGYSESLDLRTYAKLARTAEVQTWQLSGDVPELPSPSSIFVAGHIQAGDYREAVAWDEADWYAVDVPIPDRFRRLAKALEVRGSSMNVDYPEPSIVVWVEMLDYRAARTGDDVVVYSIRTDDMVEATLKELRIDDDGDMWLWPRSHDPLHQTPINIANPPEHVAEIIIKGIVIGSYRPRVY